MIKRFQEIYKPVQIPCVQFLNRAKRAPHVFLTPGYLPKDSILIKLFLHPIKTNFECLEENFWRIQYFYIVSLDQEGSRVLCEPLQQ